MLHKIHRFGACVLGVFLLGHLANQLMALSGVALYERFLTGFRLIYRQPLIETILLACVLAQIVSGGSFVWRRLRTARSGPGWLLCASGGALAVFLTIHVVAILVGRGWLEVDTNFYFAAAGLQLMPFRLFFQPYYFIGVAALFAHLACVWYSSTKGRSVRAAAAGAVLLLGGGLVVAGVIVAAFSGAWYPIDVPARYSATFGR